MSDLDNQDDHKNRIQNKVRTDVDRTKNVDSKSKLSDLDDNQDSKSRASPNLTFPRTLKRGGSQDED